MKIAFLIKKLAKGKWEARYLDGTNKVFKTLRAARAAGIPREHFVNALEIRKEII
jgi:hypothetical protein|tara:strand:+ start:1225 stop:1389 length:165 start_codon:yes stop_codon:yes gene_type:complete